MKRRITAAAMVAALAAGFLIRGCFEPAGSRSAPAAEAAASAQVWTCSMHPQIQLPAPGQCPICFMGLIPLETGTQTGSGREISVSEDAARLMQLETAEVVRRFADAEIRMVGMVDYDETRLSTISAWVPGRIDRLYVDFTGMAVEKGDHLAEFYSPELVNAQKELLHAMEKNPEMVDAVIEKFRLWGFGPEQLKEIGQAGRARDQLTINAPIGGVVIHRNASEGMYVETGSRLFTIADLSRVWVLLDAYESDLQWLRYGSRVEFTTEAYPGETCAGTITFIDPVINASTRTAKVRVIADNAGGKLKPGMFVRAVTRPRVAAGGAVIDADLSGKWISPMHPEVVKDGPGSCDVCGMPLVPAESLGYVSETAEAPLLIPATAALKTGRRAVVYVEIPDAETPTYEGREIRLGARLGDFYVVEEGLQEGERVVIRGAFKLDAELQIQARPAMMSLPSEPASDTPPELRAQTRCPVMGGEINKEVYTDYNGMRIYFCCAGCDAEFRADPEKFLAEMRAAGVEPERIEAHHAR